MSAVFGGFGAEEKAVFFGVRHFARRDGMLYSEPRSYPGRQVDRPYQGAQFRRRYCRDGALLVNIHGQHDNQALLKSVNIFRLSICMRRQYGADST